jgi:hypothetical protein
VSHVRANKASWSSVWHECAVLHVQKSIKGASQVVQRTLKAGYDLHHDERIVNVTRYPLSASSLCQYISAYRNCPEHRAASFSMRTIRNQLDIFRVWIFSQHYAPHRVGSQKRANFSVLSTLPPPARCLGSIAFSTTRVQRSENANRPAQAKRGSVPNAPSLLTANYGNHLARANSCAGLQRTGLPK